MCLKFSLYNKAKVFVIAIYISVILSIRVSNKAKITGNKTNQEIIHTFLLFTSLTLFSHESWKYSSHVPGLKPLCSQLRCRGLLCRKEVHRCQQNQTLKTLRIQIKISLQTHQRPRKENLHRRNPKNLCQTSRAHCLRSKRLSVKIKN